MGESVRRVRSRPRATAGRRWSWSLGRFGDEPPAMVWRRGRSHALTRTARAGVRRIASPRPTLTYRPRVRRTYNFWPGPKDVRANCRTAPAAPRADITRAGARFVQSRGGVECRGARRCVNASAARAGTTSPRFRAWLVSGGSNRPYLGCRRSTGAPSFTAGTLSAGMACWRLRPTSPTGPADPGAAGATFPFCY